GGGERDEARGHAIEHRPGWNERMNAHDAPRTYEVAPMPRTRDRIVSFRVAVRWNNDCRCLQCPVCDAGLAAPPLARHLLAFLSRLGKADRDRLLAALHLASLAAAAARRCAALVAMHLGLHVLAGAASVLAPGFLGHVVSPSRSGRMRE